MKLWLLTEMSSSSPGVDVAVRGSEERWAVVAVWEDALDEVATTAPKFLYLTMAARDGCQRPRTEVETRERKEEPQEHAIL